MSCVDEIFGRDRTVTFAVGGVLGDALVQPCTVGCFW
jgi:hypothetical protein